MAIIPKNMIIDSSPPTNTRLVAGDEQEVVLTSGGAVSSPAWRSHCPDQSSQFMKDFTGFEAWTEDPMKTSVVTTIADGTIYLAPAYLDHQASVQTMYALQATQGNYTADNNNKMGIYGFNADTDNFTKFAETANTGTLWKNTDNTSIQVALTADVFLMPGWYFLAMLFNCSGAPIVNPSVYGITGGSTGAQNIMQNLRAFQLAAQADLPNSFNLSSTTVNGTQRWMGMY